MDVLEGVHGCIYRASINSGPSDQTNLKGRRGCNLGGGGELTFEAEADGRVP